MPEKSLPIAGNRRNRLDKEVIWPDPAPNGCERTPLRQARHEANPTAASICDRETLFLRKNADLRKQKIQFTSKQPKAHIIPLIQELRPNPITESFHWPITGCG